MLCTVMTYSLFCLPHHARAHTHTHTHIKKRLLQEARHCDVFTAASPGPGLVPGTQQIPSKYLLIDRIKECLYLCSSHSLHLECLPSPSCHSESHLSLKAQPQPLLLQEALIDKWGPGKWLIAPHLLFCLILGIM